MEKSYWEGRWAQKHTAAFHLSDVNPRLAAHVEKLGDGGQVLVPLCGKTLDMTFLAARGFNVVGVEFVDEAAHAYFTDAGVEPARIERDGFVGYQHANVTIWVADMLAVTPELVGRVDAIYDRAAAVALPDPLREAYGRGLVTLSHAGTHLLLVTLEHDLPTGPPFSVTPEVVQALYGADFGVSLLERFDILGEDERFRQRGGTRLHEAVWVGQRR